MKISRNDFHKRSRITTGIMFLFLVVFILLLASTQQTNAANGGLVVHLTSPTGEPLNAYNLVVDSNAKNATSTAAPNVATVAVRFCNESGNGDVLTNVWGNIGDAASMTPGIYPSKTAADFSGLPGQPFAQGGGTYAFKHLGDTSDASRFIGTLADGQCSVQYWHFTYPQCENLVGAVAGDPYSMPPCNAYGAQSATWGDSVDPDDDMSLDFDVWGTAAEDLDGLGDSQDTWTMHMRNEISAMANKIKPNPDGIWFNTDTSTVYPGETVTTNGVLYEFGNINQGFDNDGDGMPDYNAWAQPIGNPSYDPSCFRLVKTETTLTVSRSGGLGVLTLNYTDQLYFTNLPSNNTGVRGVVEYTFLALGGACFSGLSPYQEVASGSDNEKFNGDYGTGIPPLQSFEAEVGIDKSSTPSTIPTGSTTTYKMPFWNDGGKDAGLYLSTGDPLNSPLVIKDVVPDGMEYVCTSASNPLYTSTPDVPDGVTIYYSNDSGASWSTNESDICGSGNPTSVTSGGNEIVIQWWLNGTLPANRPITNNNFAGFQATVPASGYTGPNFIENCATAHFGSNGPAFDEACTTIMIPGDNTLGDFVWRDMNNDGIQDGGTETGINGVLVTLYYDADGDGILDDNEKTPVTSMLTSDLGISGSGGDYDFIDLPDANYIVVVDTESTSIPTGYYPSPYTSPVTQYAVDLNDAGDLDYNDADFGFAPSVNFEKVLDSANPSYEGNIVRYSINVTNNRSGNGEPPGSCVYNVWGQTAVTGTGGTAWLDYLNAQGAPDGLYATGLYAGNGEFMNLTNFTGATVGGTISQVYVAVPIAVLPELAGDLEIEILDINDVLLGTMQVRDAASLSDGTLYIDVTGVKTWVAADFAPGATTTKIQLTTRKTSNPSGDLYVDAVGYRVTTSETCGNPSDTINFLPLTDTFDDTKLQFESANPPVTSVSGGTLTWENAGPVYAGQTKSIIVRFVALQPPDIDADGEPDPTTHTNCSATTGGTYRDGALVNDGADCVTHDINPGGEIGDLVWYNTNGDGVQDSGEYGLGNVVINLCTDAACTNIVKTTSTDSTGYYLFKGVPDGTYYAKVDTTTLPAGATWTNNWDDNCGASPCDDTSGAITIDSNDGSSANDNYYGADFGYVSVNPMVIGTVWHDRAPDGNPSPDTNDEWIAGLRVVIKTSKSNCNLLPATSNPCPTVATTDPNGSFMFTDLTAGEDYEVYVYTPDGVPVASWDQTFDTDGVGVVGGSPDPDADNDGSQVNGGANLVGSNIYRVDFSYYNNQSLNIGDTIFTDWNGDAVQDTGEEGLSGVTVELYRDLNGNGQVDADDLSLGTQVTDGVGFYQFTGQPGGTDYLVVVDASTLPAGYGQTLDPTSGSGNVCILCDNMGVLPNLSANNDLQDFAYKPTGSGSIGDFVWKDTNGDGIYTPAGADGIPGNGDDETPIANISVTLYEDSNGNGVIDASDDAVVATAQTDSNGNYLFPGLATDNKNYIVKVDDTDTDLPAGFTFPSTPIEVAVTLTNAEPTFLDADFGFTGPAKIGDYIWLDSNGDGEQDRSESGIAGVTVELLSITAFDDVNGDGRWDWGEAITTTQSLGTTLTGADGSYLFDNLDPGNYTVAVPAAGNTGSGEPLENMTNTGDPDAIACIPGCDEQTSLYIAPGGTDLSRDFGYRPEVEISGTVFFDTNDDGGIYSSGTDSPYANITVYLYDNVGVLVATTTTDANGFYEFYVPNGGGGTVYEVRYDTSSSALQGMTQNYEPTIAVAGVSVPPNSSDTGYCGTSAATCNDRALLTVSGNTAVTNQDFGFFASMDCGDLPEGATAPTGNPTLPSGFNTSLSRNGACHIVVGDLYLGAAAPDSETDGQADELAGNYSSLLGDDSTANGGTDDEDGVNRVMSGETWTPGAPVTLNLVVGGDNAANAYMVGWFDWNGDGVFGSGEMIDFGSVATGSRTITIPSSGYDTGDPLMARFRLYDGSSLPALSPSGQVANGEVEDYYWEFSSPTAVTLQSFNTFTSNLPVGFAAIIGLFTVLTLTVGLMIFSRRRNRGF